MSLDITFWKPFTLEDVENKTSIEVQFENNNWWLCKDGHSLFVYRDMNEKEYIDLKYDIIEEDGNKYAVKGDEKDLIQPDLGKKTKVYCITRYGANSAQEIMDELVTKLQTTFITDHEDYDWKEFIGTAEQFYHETTVNWGYDIDGLGGVITKI